ncbi:MAG: hypothetical protein ACMVY4_12445 [Minwuia sp.]|uniref:hypothetical protein n=1 Tax=Minwuia sp. TaxID=2493630 RepID=UPI003A837B3A
MRSFVVAIALAAAFAPAIAAACPFGATASKKAPQTVMQDTGSETATKDKKG